MSEKELERVEIEPVHHVKYNRPKFWHRVIANFVDIFIFVVLFILLFIGCRSIVEATPDYKKMDARYDEIRLDSGLYIKNPADHTQIVDIVSYLEEKVNVYGNDFEGNTTTTYTKIGTSVTAIETFRQYLTIDGVLEPENKDTILKEFNAEYNKIRLETKYENIPLFIEESGVIIPNPVLRNDPTKRSVYFTEVYAKFIDNYCQGSLSANVKEYYVITRNFAFLIITLEAPISYIIAGILTWFVPGLFFRRGRKSLGKALYHIGLINTKTVLSPSLARYTARFCIFLFGELILSIFTFGLPYIISSSMMAFSKNKQGFPDYMLGLMEVDTSNNNIYLDYVDAQLKEGVHGKPVDFKMKKPL